MNDRELRSHELQRKWAAKRERKNLLCATVSAISVAKTANETTGVFQGLYEDSEKWCRRLATVLIILSVLSIWHTIVDFSTK